MTITPDTSAPADELDNSQNNIAIAIRLGKKLRNARLKKKLTLEAIAEQLKIRENQLRALEKGDYESLPEMTYAIGFMRAYAEYLELPAEEILGDFKHGMGQVNRPLEQPTTLREVPRSKSSMLYFFSGAIIVSIGLYFAWTYYNGLHDEVQINDLPPSITPSTTPTPTLENEIEHVDNY